jgi:hypothetical protein
VTRALPNFFIVGAAKAGTTSLARYLASHPAVFLCPVKEPNHFATDIDETRFRTDYRRAALFDMAAYLRMPKLEERHTGHVAERSDYLQLFREVAGETAIGEASVSYLYSRTAAAAIQDEIPDARIIISLRDPVDRAYSHYRMDVAAGMATGDDFCDAIDRDQAQIDKGWGVSSLYLELGLYHDQVERYLDRFGRDRVRILLYEQWTSRPAETVGSLLEFLEIDADGPPVPMANVFNPGVEPRFPSVNRWVAQNRVAHRLAHALPTSLRRGVRHRALETTPVGRAPTAQERARLLPYFEQDISATAALIGMDLSGWLARRA